MLTYPDYMDWMDWFDFAMPKAKAESLHLKFKEEAQEFIEQPSLEELVDCVATLYRWADRMGYTMGNIHDAFKAKLEKNRGRTWELLQDGTYHHIKTPTD